MQDVRTFFPAAIIACSLLIMGFTMQTTNAADFEITVRPELILYAPGDTAAALLTARNTTERRTDAALKLSLVNNLSDTKVIAGETLSLPAGDVAELRVEFTAPEVQYGQELRAELLQDGEVVASASDYFSVADSVWKVALMEFLGGITHHTAPHTEEQIAAQIARHRNSYVNWIEFFFWAPDDWGNMTPEPGATWRSGQAAFYHNTEKLAFAIREAQSHGMKVVTYAKCVAGGLDGWEMARSRPQWFLVDRQGQTFGRPLNAWDLDNWQNLKYNILSDMSGDWTYRVPDLRRLDALDHGINEFIQSKWQFGWDGLRFDSGGFRALNIDGRTWGNPAVNIRNMKRTKERIWQEFPNCLFGYNTNNTAATDGREYPLTPAEMSHEMREMLAGGGLWMGEALRETTMRNGSVKYNTWSQFLQDEVRCIAAIWQAGGHFCYSYGRSGTNLYLYKTTIGTVIGAHPYISPVNLVNSENSLRFLTRWSGFFYDNTMRPAAPEEHNFAVSSQRPLWWREMAKERVASPTRRFLIVHLINPPLEDKVVEIEDTPEALPKPVADATVSFTPPAGEKLVRTFLLLPGKPDRAEILNVSVEKGVVNAPVPEFRILATVIFELEGAYEMPPATPRYSEPMTAEQLAELERTTPREMDKTPWFRNIPPAPTPDIAIADDVHDPAPAYTAPPAARNWKPAESTPPPGWRVGSETGKKVLVYIGHYHYMYDLEQAVQSAAPDATVEYAAWTKRIRGKGHLQEEPNYERLSKFDAVVLVNVDAGSFHSLSDSRDSDWHQVLADYVRAGGRLTVLGGPRTLGQGWFKGTAIEEVLPVEVHPALDVYQLPEPRTIGSAEDTSLDDSPMLYYYHAAKPRPDAAVLAYAEDLPILLERKVGNGSSVVFLGTMLGEPAEGGTAFWQSEEFMKLLGTSILGND